MPETLCSSVVGVEKTWRKQRYGPLLNEYCFTKATAPKLSSLLSNTKRGQQRIDALNTVLKTRWLDLSLSYDQYLNLTEAAHVMELCFCRWNDEPDWTRIIHV